MDVLALAGVSSLAAALLALSVWFRWLGQYETAWTYAGLAAVVMAGYVLLLLAQAILYGAVA